MWSFENKIRKMLKKIEVIDLIVIDFIVIDLIEIEIVMSEKWHIFGIAVPGCEL